MSHRKRETVPDGRTNGKKIEEKKSALSLKHGVTLLYLQYVFQTAFDDVAQETLQTSLLSHPHPLLLHTPTPIRPAPYPPSAPAPAQPKPPETSVVSRLGCNLFTYRLSFCQSRTNDHRQILLDQC